MLSILLMPQREGHITSIIYLSYLSIMAGEQAAHPSLMEIHRSRGLSCEDVPPTGHINIEMSENTVDGNDEKVNPNTAVGQNKHAAQNPGAHAASV